MLNQNKLLRRHALGSFRLAAARDHARTPRCCCGCPAPRTRSASPNENYARELMELFTLGAGPRLHRARRARAGPRADRLRATTGSAAPAPQLPLRPGRHDDGHEAIFGKTRRASTGRTPSGCASTTRQHPSFFVDKLWSYFVPTPPGRGDAAGARAALPQGLPDPARRRGDPPPPALHNGPRMVKPPVVYIAGLLRAHRPRRRHRGVVVALERAGQRLFMPPNVSGWDDDALARHRDLPRPLGGRELRAAAVRADRQAAADAARRAAGARGRARSRSGAHPTLRPATRAALLAFATTAMGDADADAGRRRATAS